MRLSTFGRYGRVLQLGVAVIALAGLVFAGTVSRLFSEATASCGALTSGSIAESQEFTPYEARRSRLPEFPLNPLGQGVPALSGAAGAAATAVDGRSLRWAVVTDTGSVYRYFLDAPVTTTMTPRQFLAQGGLQYEVEPVTEGLSFATELRRQFPTRAVAVTVGAYAGAITWADPDASGVRTHNVYWSDGKYNYSLIVNRPATDAATLARGIACGQFG